MDEHDLVRSLPPDAGVQHIHRACLGLLALVRRYSADRLEAACTRAMAIRAPHLRSVTSILKCGLDSQPTLAGIADNPVIEHENVRGPDYYH